MEECTFFVISDLFLGAAVAALTSSGNIRGVVRFLQKDENHCIVDGTIDGLTPGEHGLHVYEYGDISGGCTKYVWLSVVMIIQYFKSFYNGCG